MTSLRISLALLACGLGVGAVAPEALAHGGQFRGPGGGVPPGLRPPSDPTPPSAPPPSSTTPAPSTTPTGPGGPPGGPVTPGGPTPTPTTTPPGTGVTPGARRQATATPDDWQYWYQYNKASIERLKQRLYALEDSSTPFWDTGARDETSRTQATLLIRKLVESDIVPALLWTMDPANRVDDDTESAAYLALAKVTRDPRHADVIEKGLALGANRRPPLVVESAALALGLLRRSDPSEQFSARDLDRVRERLFAMVENDEYRIRARGFAALAIGLLGDQPTGSGAYVPASGDETSEEEMRSRGAQRTVQRLFDLLAKDHGHSDVAVALLLGLSMQPPSAVSDEIRDALSDCALKGRMHRRKVENVVRAHAALVLGRVGNAGSVPQLEAILRARSVRDADIRRSAAIGLGSLGRLVEGDARRGVVAVLLEAMRRESDDGLCNFAAMSLARLLMDEVAASRTDLFEGRNGPDEMLLETAREGRHLRRPFAALALARVVALIDERKPEAMQTFATDARKALREGLASKKYAAPERAAYATALGIAGDVASRNALVTILKDDRADKELRGYAAVGLGLLHDRSAETTEAMAEALRERSSEELRRQAATALGLLGNPRIGRRNTTAIDLLLTELSEAQSQSHVGQVILALTRVGNAQAVAPLIDRVHNERKRTLIRALACAGLGVVGDMEELPSLSRLAEDVNYRAYTDVMLEALSIL
jgi:hypothetical protein